MVYIIYKLFHQYSKSTCSNLRVNNTHALFAQTTCARAMSDSTAKSSCNFAVQTDIGYPANIVLRYKYIRRTCEIEWI